MRWITGLGTALIVLSGVFTGVLLLEALLAPGDVHAAERPCAEGLDPGSAVTVLDAVAALSLPVMLALWVVASVWLQTELEKIGFKVNIVKETDATFRQVVRARLEWSLREGMRLYPEAVVLWNSVR